MQLRLGTITIKPDEEHITIPVDIYSGEDFVTGEPLAQTSYQATLNTSKPLADYIEEAKAHAKNVIHTLSQQDHL